MGSHGLERGLPIVKRTLCSVGCHVFTWTSSGTSNTPDPATACDCGITTYGDMTRPPSHAEGEK